MECTKVGGSGWSGVVGDRRATGAVGRQWMKLCSGVQWRAGVWRSGGAERGLQGVDGRAQSLSALTPPRVSLPPPVHLPPPCSRQRSSLPLGPQLSPQPGEVLAARRHSFTHCFVHAHRSLRCHRELPSGSCRAVLQLLVITSSFAPCSPLHCPLSSLSPPRPSVPLVEAEFRVRHDAGVRGWSAAQHPHRRRARHLPALRAHARRHEDGLLLHRVPRGARRRRRHPRHGRVQSGGPEAHRTAGQGQGQGEGGLPSLPWGSQPLWGWWGWG